jgi:hypothetical protein
MKKILLAATLFACLVPIPVIAQSGATTGAVTGAVGGAVVGGPVGAVVGGVGGAVVGGVIDGASRPRFHEYVVREKRPSYRYDREVAVGAELPSEGVNYYDVPPEYGVKEYQYTIINGHTVLVNPRTRQIVEIID